MKKIIAAAVLAVLIAAGVFYLSGKRGNGNENVEFSGTVEVTDVVLSFKTSGRLVEVGYKEGDTVPAGAVAARLDDADQKLAVKTAEANVAVSEAALQELLAGSRRQEIQNAEAAVDMANAALMRSKDDMEQARADRARFEYLYQNSGLSKYDFEQIDTKYNKSVSTVKEAEGAVKSAKEKLSLALEGTRSETIKKAYAALELAKSQLMTAKQNLEYTALTSPITGRVLTRAAEPGEFVQTGSAIMNVADLNDSWVRGYIGEKVLGRVHLGDVVEIRSDSYPDKVFKGRVSFIADEAEFTPKSVQTPEERVNFMYRIKVVLDNEGQMLKTGMPVDGTIVLSR
ncbi:efflux RND transporter periplasmic adaptor subunit [Seleniivibrio woodruffii]|uniref:HlyD family secretion protein n=1 Tax=Seleniivibrio woodruffii TaxID=1078050 RepID=A0A4R1KD20_9BACT|nr:efflux RND transporter periplasmic adaptor subunit [Seleniivibrio woodruffii]TCK62538.1 HlyD family secretion protein [Seleniivibrio woodruffii]TVZ37035.1 HlyD family secretion protein [Seleniivibrio woodruffii]